MRGYYKNTLHHSDEAPIPRKKRSRKKAIIIAASLLGVALLACLAAGIVSLAMSFSGNYVAGSLPQNDVPGGSHSEEMTGECQLEKAEIGTGVTLTLEQPDGAEKLSYNEIYRKNIESITCVYVTDGLRASGMGTGVVMTSDGYIITNAHVVDGMSEAYVATYEGEVLPAKLVGEDVFSDLAVLKIEPQLNLVPATFGRSDVLQVGDSALALGNPLGIELWGTMTNGIISAINRDVSMGSYSMTLIQTTAALNSGNSGGALLNNRGQVIGITNMKMMSNNNTIEGLGFAIPAETVQQVVNGLIENGRYDGKPTIGITGTPSNDEEHPGVAVFSVEPMSDAAKQGLQVGDIIFEVNGVEVTSVDDINAIKADKRIGDKMKMKIYRPGTDSVYEVAVELIGSYDLNN